MKLRLIGDPILESPCSEITSFNKRLRNLSKSMHKFMKKKQGIGLAAPQIGESIQLVVINIDQPFTIINPYIKSYIGDEVTLIENCLSIPNMSIPISRPEGIVITYLDEYKERKSLEAHGWLSRCIQHELGVRLVREKSRGCKNLKRTPGKGCGELSTCA